MRGPDPGGHPEDHLDELLRLLERHMGLSQRLDALSEPELAEFHGNRKRTGEVIARLVAGQTATAGQDIPRHFRNRRSGA